MLKIRGLYKNFGGLEILRNVGLDVNPGSITGLIGPNGAGKTTVFNCITGLVTPTSGKITLGSHDLLAVAPHQVTQLGVARTFQNIRVFKDMTLLENVMVGMHDRLDYSSTSLLLSSSDFKKQEDKAVHDAIELLKWFRLEKKATQLASSLSYGEQRRLEFARALATQPKLLLLDEPVAGMNGAEKTELMHELKNIRNRGVTIFLIEHDMRFVMGLCDQITVLNFGEVIAQGSPNEIKQNPLVIEAYLGADEDAAA